MMRIVYVENSAATFASHRMDLARAAADRGLEVHVAVPAGGPDLALQDKRFIIHRIAMERRNVSPGSEARSIGELVRLYASLRPDLVHHIRLKPILHGSLAARLTGVPAVVNSVTGLGYLFARDGGRMPAVRALVKAGLMAAGRHPGHRIVFQNVDDCDLFIRQRICGRSQSAVIRGAGVDLERYASSPEPAGIPLAILPSRMLWDKGVAEFVSAARILKSSGINARFALVGDGDPENRSCVPLAELERWRDSEVVEWWGWQEDVRLAFKQCHIVCLPSYREGLPKVLIEAAAAGRPIVTTNTPGCREVVRHEENGLLVPVADAAGLALALGRLISDPELRIKLGRKGRKIAEAEFATKRIIAETFQVYRELLRTSPRLEGRRFAECLGKVVNSSVGVAT